MKIILHRGLLSLLFLYALTGLSTAFAQSYDPNTKVYADALWYRVHAEGCPELILKENKKCLTLTEADKAGYRIGEFGQTGRENCCLKGYKKKHPLKKLTDETIVAGNDLKKNYKHIPGCHRYEADRNHKRWTIKEAKAQGFKICPHCIERGPSVASISAEEWKKLGPVDPFVGPEGWVAKPFSSTALPPKKELDVLVQEYLEMGSGIQELQFTDPVASVENFMIRRFFFPVTMWNKWYMLYRSTGDKRFHDKLLVSARHYCKLSVDYKSAAQQKAKDPEGLAYMFSMAVCSRITVQNAIKHPDKSTEKEINEAEEFLKAMLAVLKPICEGNDSLDSEMGIPKNLAEDFRSRAFNRAMNGIGVLAMITVSLEDLQKLKKTDTYQATIDRYRKIIQAYIKNFLNEGHFCNHNGKNHFYYPYKAGKIGTANGCVLFKRPEDGGHYSHTVQGLVRLYETMPEVGIDDAFMTAVANSVFHNATTKIKKHGKMQYSGHLQCPNQYTKRPYGKRKGEAHKYSPGRNKFYVFQAFRDDMIDGVCNPLNKEKKAALNSEPSKRVSTLYVHYLKAFRKNKTLIHLGENND